MKKYVYVIRYSKFYVVSLFVNRVFKKSYPPKKTLEEALKLKKYLKQTEAI